MEKDQAHQRHQIMKTHLYYFMKLILLMDECMSGVETQVEQDDKSSNFQHSTVPLSDILVQLSSVIEYRNSILVAATCGREQ